MTLGKTVAQLRTEYRKTVLRNADMHPDPFLQFEEWFALAVEEYPNLANAMTLATVSDGQPSARVVLLKGFDSRGFVFYTNYESRKSHEIEVSPMVALNFWWSGLERQVGIEGRAHRVSEVESDEYFQSRDRGSQVGAWASQQSQAIPDRAHLDEGVAALRRKFDGRDEIPRPKNWGGWCVVPDLFEFWQGRENRLHDRFRYRLESAGRWQMDRLAP